MGATLAHRSLSFSHLSLLTEFALAYRVKSVNSKAFQFIDGLYLFLLNNYRTATGYMKDEFHDAINHRRGGAAQPALRLVHSAPAPTAANDSNFTSRAIAVGNKPLRLWFEGDISNCAEFTLTSVLEAHEDELWGVVQDLYLRGIDTLGEINGRAVKDLCGPDQSVTIADIRKLIDTLNIYCMEAYLSYDRC